MELEDEHIEMDRLTTFQKESASNLQQQHLAIARIRIRPGNESGKLSCRTLYTSVSLFAGLAPHLLSQP